MQGYRAPGAEPLRPPRCAGASNAARTAAPEKRSQLKLAPRPEKVESGERFPLLETYSRVAPGQKDIRQKIPGHEQAGSHHHAIDHEIKILRKKRFHGQAAESGPCHDIFHNKSSAQ